MGAICVPTGSGFGGSVDGGALCVVHDSGHRPSELIDVGRREPVQKGVVELGGGWPSGLVQPPALIGDEYCSDATISFAVASDDQALLFHPAHRARDTGFISAQLLGDVDLSRSIPVVEQLQEPIMFGAEVEPTKPVLEVLAEREIRSMDEWSH